MKLLSLLAAAAALAIGVQCTPTPTKPTTTIERRNSEGFVTAKDGKFWLDGKSFFYAGTNAYWLTQLNDDQDICDTLQDIADKGLKVVRIWGFREVVGTPPPDNRTYTAVWNGSTQTINQAGVDRIGYVLDQAKKLGLKVHISLTNNWAPTYPPNAGRPNGYYSNSFGGIDTYVQQLHPKGDRDLFFTDDKIISQYENYVKHIVTQFKDHCAVFAWEVANDPRCKGAEGFTTSGSCGPQTITRWTNRLSAFIKSIDPNHMAASGDGGFFCVDCPKVNTHPSVSGPQPSAGARRKRHSPWLTTADVLSARREARKIAARMARQEAGTLRRIRGAWTAPVASVKSWARQGGSETSVGAPFDGSQGVDSEDIAASPNIDFTSFQLFPDQNNYANGADSNQPPADGAGGENFGSTVSQGLDWIVTHGTSSQNMGKPSSLNSFGLVSQSSETNFTPFDSTNTGIGVTDPVATDEQQQSAYTQWTNQAVTSGINGITHYQWGKTGLHSQAGSVIDDSNTFGDSSTQASTQGSSPNDGYSSGPNSGIQGILSNVAATQNGKDSS